MLSNQKLNRIVTELFIRSRKLNIYLAFITQAYFTIIKNIRLNSTHYYIMKTQQNAFNHSSDINFKDFMNFYMYYKNKKCTTKPCSFLLNDTNFESDNPFLFRKNLLEQI